MDRREPHADRRRSRALPGVGARWPARLAQAKTEAQVIGVCRDFLVSIPPAELARLALACRPVPLEDAAGLSVYALQLVRHYCESNDAAPLVLRMASFFAHANVRMAKILRRGEEALAARALLGAGDRPPAREPRVTD
jgi:hypothetical protein